VKDLYGVPRRAKSRRCRDQRLLIPHLGYFPQEKRFLWKIQITVEEGTWAFPLQPSGRRVRAVVPRITETNRDAEAGHVGSRVDTRQVLCLAEPQVGSKIILAANAGAATCSDVKHWHRRPSALDLLVPSFTATEVWADCTRWRRLTWWT